MLALIAAEMNGNRSAGRRFIRSRLYTTICKGRYRAECVARKSFRSSFKNGIRPKGLCFRNISRSHAGQIAGLLQPNVYAALLVMYQQPSVMASDRKRFAARKKNALAITVTLQIQQPAVGRVESSRAKCQVPNVSRARK